MPGKEIVLSPAEYAPVASAPPWPQDKPRESDAAIVTIARWAKRNGHFTVPLAVPPAMWLAGLALHHYRTGPYVLACGVLLAACVWFFAPHKWDRKAEQWYARLSAALGAGWLALAAFAGPLSGSVTAVALAALLAAGGVAWGFLWWRHKRPRGMRKRNKLIAQCDAWWLSHCHAWNLHGSHVIDAKLSGVTLWMRVQGIAGRHSFQHFQQAVHLIESAAEGQSDIGLVRVAAVKGHPSQADIFLKQENPLREPVEYDMALAPQSVHDPAPFGKLESVTWKMVSLRKNRFTNGETRSGKALALDTRIPTPSGWTTMGEIQAGDMVFDELGQPCRVLWATDVMHDHDCYRVKFSDGSEITADAGHLWLVETRASRAYESATGTYERRGERGYARAKDALASWPKILTTEEMAGSLRASEYANYSVPVAAPLQGADAELPISPYTLGAWLGDGTSATGSLTTADPEIISEIEAEGETAWRIACTVRAHCPSYRIRGLTTRLGNAGLIGNKHIPVPYLRASESQRRALLAGLLDTDGYCTGKGTAQYYSISEQLARDVHHLVATLGYKPTLRSKRAAFNGADCGIAWVVAFTPGDKVFRLPRKVARQVARGAPATKRRFVVSIEPVPSVPVRCIAVDSPAHLYLAGDSCIPTHNSNDLLVGLANLSGCPDARPVLIDLKGGRSGRPVLKSGAAEYVITEVDEARMFLRMMVAEEKARSMYAYDGNEQLLATEDVPAIHTVIDETHGLTSTMNGDAECRRLLATLASEGSGLEAYVWVYTQHGSLEESVGTEQTRANLPFRTCYRVAEARHGAYTIPEYAKLDASKLEEDGTCYIKYGKNAIPEQIRAPYMPHQLFFRIAAQNARLLGPRPPLRLYCGGQVAYRAGDRDVTWQEWWDTRWLRLHPAFRADSPQYQAAVAEAGGAPGTQVTADAAAPVPSPAPGTGDARSAAARIAGEDAGLMSRIPADFRPDPRLVSQLPAMMASQEDRFAGALEAADADSPATPKDLMAASGFASSWVHGRLAALAEIGLVTQLSKGRYVTVPGGDIRRGLQEIKDRNARLNAEARQKIDAASR